MLPLNRYLDRAFASQADSLPDEDEESWETDPLDYMDDPDDYEEEEDED